MALLGSFRGDAVGLKSSMAVIVRLPTPTPLPKVIMLVILDSSLVEFVANAVLLLLVDVRSALYIHKYPGLDDPLINWS